MPQTSLTATVVEVVLNLVPMTEREHGEWMDIAISSYAAAKVQSGDWKDSDADQLARRAFDALLTDGAKTTNHQLLSVRSSELDCSVGYLWFAIEDGKIFLYDITILPNYRRQGFGRQAMQALERRAVELGIGCVSLHVFAHNEGARALYEHLNYKVTDLTMQKRV